MALNYFQGGKFDDRTLAMYQAATKLLSFEVFVAQGGFNPGGVGASAGTHDRAAVDVGGSLLSPDQRVQVATALRRVGFAAWVRTPAQGFTSYHIHGVPIGGDVSSAAASQVSAYKAGRNGLAGNGPDDGTRAYVNVTWETYSSSNVSGSGISDALKQQHASQQQEEDDMYGDDDRKRDTDTQFKANGAYAASSDADKRIQDLQAVVGSLQDAIKNIQVTSNAAYANSGQVLNEFRQWVASQKPA